MRLRKTRNETTAYSPEIKGADGNYGWKVRFDLTGSYLGITQERGNAPMQRVLLSPDQIQALIRFVMVKHATR